VINNVVLVGRATRDPEVSTFNSGSKVAKVGIALNRPGKEKKTDFFDVEIWGKSAEVAETYLKKGHLFGVEAGRLELQTWESNGNKRSKVVVSTHNIKLMQPKGSGDAEPEQEQQQQQEPTDDVFGGFAGDDEMPF
jgi:single-strand DNA-binding protein